MAKRTEAEAEYLHEFPDVLVQVIAEVFNEPLMVAGGIHLDTIFISEHVVSASVAGWAAGFTALEAIACLCFLEFNAAHQSTSKLQRLGNKRLRERYADLKTLCERLFALVKDHVERDSEKFQTFSKTMADEMVLAMERNADGRT